MRGAEAASDADWGPLRATCSPWQASGRKKRRPEAISGFMSAPLCRPSRPRRAKPAPLGRARAGGWLRGSGSRSACAGSSQRPEIIRPRRSRRTPLLHAARRPARGRARSGGWRRRHGSMKRCAGCSRARNHSALGARPLATLLLCSLAARRRAAGRPPRPPRTRANAHTPTRERKRVRARATHRQNSQCFSP